MENKQINNKNKKQHLEHKINLYMKRNKYTGEI